MCTCTNLANFAHAQAFGLTCPLVMSQESYRFVHICVTKIQNAFAHMCFIHAGQLLWHLSHHSHSQGHIQEAPSALWLVPHLASTLGHPLLASPSLQVKFTFIISCNSQIVGATWWVIDWGTDRGVCVPPAFGMDDKTLADPKASSSEGPQ